MLTGFETKKLIVNAGDANMRPQAPVNVVDGDGSAVIVGRAEASVDDTVVYPTGRRGQAREAGEAERGSGRNASSASPRYPQKSLRARQTPGLVAGSDPTASQDHIIAAASEPESTRAPGFPPNRNHSVR